MLNAKAELLEHIQGKTIKCASIKYGNQFDDSKQLKYNLRVGYSSSEFNEFINSLDFSYDSGYGGQELFGIVWYMDGTWSDRGEYDGSEWWNYQVVPLIPEELR